MAPGLLLSNLDGRGAVWVRAHMEAWPRQRDRQAGATAIDFALVLVVYAIVMVLTVPLIDARLQRLAYWAARLGVGGNGMA
jgi:Flp pilus assembly pilin Flp